MRTTILSSKQSRVSTSSPTLVLVEDDVSSAKMLRLLIQTETAWRLFVLSSGQAALQRMNDLIAMHPALFLLDYRLPGMSGLTLYDRLHATPAFKDVPALIFTAHLAPAVLDNVLQHGLPLLFKPFDVDDLLNLLEQYLLPESRS